MPPQPWKRLGSRTIFTNEWICLREDTVELPDGSTTPYGVVTLGEAVSVLPFVDDEHVLLVRQYRYVLGESHRWELPSGGMDPGETPEQAAVRELREEVGYTARKLEWLSTFYSSVGVCEAACHVFMGSDLTPADLPSDATESLEIRTFPFRDVVEMARKSEIREAASVVAILHAAQRLA